MRPLSSLALLLAAVAAQPPSVRDLFPPRPTCCLPGRKLSVGKTTYHVVSDPKTRRELFRIRIGGQYEGEWLSWWTYGVRNCGDFNRDGVLDYSWYGGDDTTSGHFLVLSTPSGHRIIDITKTFQHAWARQRGGKAPDLELNYENFLHRVTLHWAREGLALVAEGQPLNDKAGKFIRMKVEEQYWVE